MLHELHLTLQRSWVKGQVYGVSKLRLGDVDFLNRQRLGISLSVQDVLSASIESALSEQKKRPQQRGLFIWFLTRAGDYLPQGRGSQPPGLFSRRKCELVIKS